MQSKDESTVVAVFDQASNAQSAVQELRSQGFGADRIYLSNEGVTEGQPSTQAAGDHESGAKRLLHAVFGVHEHIDKPAYVRAVAGGKTIVSIHVPDASVAKVSDTLKHFSPIGVHAESYEEAIGISTPDTDCATMGINKSELLNAEDELKTSTHAAGRVMQGDAVRVYRRQAESEATTRLD